jgi:Mg2+ and Co2+ transporter CorA
MHAAKPTAPRAPDASQPRARMQAMLFDADGGDRAVELGEIDPAALNERRLLWVDVEDDDSGGAMPLLAQLVRLLDLGDAAMPMFHELNGASRLHNVGAWFLAQDVAVEHEGHLRFGGRPLAIVCGDNFVVSLHRGPLDLIEQLRSRERAESRIGSLSAESFAASLLDWVVESYQQAVSDFEAAVDRLEVSVLASPIHREYLPDLAQLRRGASRLRRMLSPQRQVFGALARPDFRPSDDGVADKHFRALEQRFDRAMDAVENTRELVVGSFELFTTRSAERTNDTMRVLTFVTVLLGSLAVVAGALGMNFKTPFFDTGDRGFWSAIVAMAIIALLATALARWRRWF